MESVGQRLKKEREARYLTLEKASAATRIRVVFLQALEADDYSALPSAAQGRGFLRNYAEYLGLNLDELIAEIRRNAPAPEVSGPLTETNLAETELPIPLEEGRPARGFFARWFDRRQQEEALPEETQPEAEIKLEAEPQPEIEQPRAGFWSKLKSILPVRKSQSEVEAAGESAQSDSQPPIVEEPKLREPLLPADRIFAEIGRQLRERRELISLTVEEVERHTRLRAAFIRALEAGDYVKLPSPVQTRGMLANYATFLDVDVEALLLRFADGLQARRHEKYAEIPREKIETGVNASMPRLRLFIAGDLIFGLIIIVALVGLAVWGMRRIVANQEAAPAPTAPPFPGASGGLQPTQATLGVTFAPAEGNFSAPTLGEAALTAETTPTLASSANVVVEAFALERTFVRISVDGKVAFEGRMAPRETRVFEANDQVAVLTGNGAALRIKYNGDDLGLMGSMGEVVSRTYLITGVATPTATISPTPTNTLFVTTTPTFTLTPTFTAPSP